MSEPKPGDFSPEDSHPKAKEKINREFYKSNERSWTLRDISIEIIRVFNKLFAATPEERGDLTGQLERLNGKLIEVGISPNMHLGKTKSEFEQDSVMAAEYLSGQLARLMSDPLHTEADTMRSIVEFSATLAPDTYIIDNKDNPPKEIHQFMAQRSTVNLIQAMFDISNDELK